MYFINKFKSATYVTCVFHFSLLSFNSTLPPKKKNLVLILAQKKIFLKKSTLQTTKICEWFYTQQEHNLALVFVN